MADFSALKQSIETYIKNNGNKEITGAILQKILLSMVTTMGDGAINDNASDISDIKGDIQNINGDITDIKGDITDINGDITGLNGDLSDEVNRAKGAETTTILFSDGKLVFKNAAGTVLYQLSVDSFLSAITTRLNTGALYAGYATPSTTPATLTSQEVFYLATQAGTYTNFHFNGGDDPIVLTKDGIYFIVSGDGDDDWNAEPMLQLDDEPTAKSDNPVKSGGVFPTFNAVNKALIHITGNVSIIGDSISTFNGTMPSGYATYYPQQSLGVISLYDMWWHLLLSMTNSKLEVNASWSGSRVTNTVQNVPDFYNRTNVLSSPDYIFVALGTNDSLASVVLGDYDYDTEDLSEIEFIPAYIKGVKALKTNYPNAKIVLFIFQMADSYANAIKNIGKHYELDVIDVRSYYINNVHPNKLQMCSVAQTISSFYIRGKCDDIPTAVSNNLVKSGGIFESSLKNIWDVAGICKVESETDANDIYLPLNLKAGQRYVVNNYSSDTMYIGGYDENKQVVEQYGTVSANSQKTFTPTSDAYYFLFYFVKAGTAQIEYAQKNNLTSIFVGKKVSIIGDNLDTFTGYNYTGYETYYPRFDVNHVDDMWWKKVLDTSGAVLEVNASDSSSRVTTYSTHPDLYARVGIIGNPDVIFVTLGSYDSYHRVSLGDYDFETSYEELSESTFRTAYIKGIKALLATYPNAQIVCITRKMDNSYRLSVEYIANKLDVMYIDASDFVGYNGTIDADAKGMAKIASLVLNPTDKDLHQAHIPADAKAVGKIGTGLVDVTREVGCFTVHSEGNGYETYLDINLVAGKEYTIQNNTNGIIYIGSYNEEKIKVENLGGGAVAANTTKKVLPSINAKYLLLYFTSEGVAKIFNDHYGFKVKIDISKYYFCNGFIVSSADAALSPSMAPYVNLWYKASGVDCVFIPVSEGEHYAFKNPHNKAFGYTFLSDRVVGNTGDTPAYASGFDSLVMVGAGEEVDVIVPSNAPYLVFFDASANNLVMDCYKYTEKVLPEYSLQDVFQFAKGNSSWYNQRRNYLTLCVPNAVNENIDNVLALQNKSNYGVPANVAINFLDSAGTEKCAIGYSHNSTIDGVGGYYPNTLYLEIGNAFSSDRNSDVDFKVITTRNGMNPRQAVLLTIGADGNIDLYPAACGTEGAKVTIHGDLRVTGQIINE